MESQTAIVFGASGGIGAAFVTAVEAENRFDRVIAFSRHSEPPIDLCNEASIKEAAEWVRLLGLSPSMMIVASGILHNQSNGPEKSLSHIDPDWMLENYRINAVGPVLIAKHFLPLAPRKGRVIFAALSARVGSISDNHLGGWHSYRASKAALNMLIRNIAIEWQRKNDQSIVVGLHPGTVETALSAAFKGNVETVRFEPALSTARLMAVLDALEPSQTGQTFAHDGTIIAP